MEERQREDAEGDRIRITAAFTPTLAKKEKQGQIYFSGEVASLTGKINLPPTMLHKLSCKGQSQNVVESS